MRMAMDSVVSSAAASRSSASPSNPSGWPESFRPLMAPRHILKFPMDVLARVVGRGYHVLGVVLRFGEVGRENVSRFVLTGFGVVGRASGGFEECAFVAVVVVCFLRVVAGAL